MPIWKIRGDLPFELCPQRPYGLWGILNITPDSFSDGGLYALPGAALEQACRLMDQGCAVLDVGAASSRPGAHDLPECEEIARLAGFLPLLQQQKQPEVRLSVDTWRAGAALYALEQGADIINDISACLWEPALLEIVAQHRPGYVLMHCQGRPGSMQAAPRYGQVVDQVLDFFEQRLLAISAAGLPEEYVLLDPGIGFGKTMAHNLALLAALPRMQSLGRPLLVGLSRKSLWQQAALAHLGDCGSPGPWNGHKDRPLDVAALDQATLAATALLGEHVFHRVHDVAGARLALTVARAMRNESEVRSC